MDLLVQPTGAVHCIYSEEIELAALGQPTIRRASHVEPDEAGQWWADLSPVNGPKLGPFAYRRAALAAEAAWLSAHLPHVIAKQEGNA